MLAVPDAAYTSWVVRLDLSRLAIEGVGADAQSKEASPEPEAPPATQRDNVAVTPRRVKRHTGTEK